jgi:hypothetical protein
VLGKICFAAAMAVMAHSATADVIDFTAAGAGGPFIGPVFSDGILTVTASPGDVYIDALNGLGVSGGTSIQLELGEVLTFSFSQAVTNILMNKGNTINNGDIQFTGFFGGSQVGTAIYNPTVTGTVGNGNFDVSALIGGPVISFTFTPVGGLSPFFTTSGISFDRVVPPVPLPASGLLLIGAVAVAVGLRRNTAPAA